MQVLREFKGKCRNQAYNYKLYRIENELILESYQGGEMIDSLTWDDNNYNLKLVNAACDAIAARG